MQTPRINLWTFSRYMEAYRREKEHFVNAVLKEGGKVSITGKMVVAVGRICEALQTSAETGEPVEIQWEDEEVPDEYK